MTVTLAPLPVCVQVSASGSLFLSQAVGDPIEVQVSGFTFIFKPEGIFVKLDARYEGRRLTMRDGRRIQDLENTNPGFSVLCKDTWPFMPWSGV